MILIEQAGQLTLLSVVHQLSDDARIFIDECLLYDFSLSRDATAKDAYRNNPEQFVAALAALDNVIEYRVRNADVPAFVDFLREFRPVQDVIDGSPKELIAIFYGRYFGAGPFDSEVAFAKYYCEERNYLKVPSYVYKYIDYGLVAMDLFKRGDVYMTENGYVFIFFVRAQCPVMVKGQQNI